MVNSKMRMKHGLQDTTMQKCNNAAQRQAALRKRRLEQGLVRLQVWVTREQAEKIKTMLKQGDL